MASRYTGTASRYTRFAGCGGACAGTKKTVKNRAPGTAAVSKMLWMRFQDFPRLEKPHLLLSTHSLFPPATSQYAPLKNPFYSISLQFLLKHRLTARQSKVFPAIKCFV
jgi:hypothetical protein